MRFKLSPCGECGVTHGVVTSIESQIKEQIYTQKSNAKDTLTFP